MIDACQSTSAYGIQTIQNVQKDAPEFWKGIVGEIYFVIYLNT